MFGLNIMGYIGWGLFIVTLIALFFQHQRHIKFRVSLSTYSKWLLLDDTIRNNHKTKFIEFLKNTEFSSDQDLYITSDRVIEDMATSLWGAGSLLAVQQIMSEHSNN